MIEAEVHKLNCATQWYANLVDIIIGFPMDWVQVLLRGRKPTQIQRLASEQNRKMMGKSFILTVSTLYYEKVDY